MAFKPAFTKRLLERVDELPTEDTAEDADRREEELSLAAALAMHPAGTVEGDSTAGYNSMEMRMVHQVLAPRMNHGQDADLRAEMLGVGRHFLQGLGGGLEQNAVGDPLVLQCERRCPFRELQAF